MYACDYLETGFLNVLRGVTFAAPTKVYLALFLNLSLIHISEPTRH